MSYKIENIKFEGKHPEGNASDVRKTAELLEIGQSFLVTNKKKMATYMNVSRFNQRFPNKRLCFKTEENGFRIYRVR